MHTKPAGEGDKGGVKGGREYVLNAEARGRSKHKVLHRGKGDSMLCNLELGRHLAWMEK